MNKFLEHQVKSFLLIFEVILFPIQGLLSIYDRKQNFPIFWCWEISIEWFNNFSKMTGKTWEKLSSNLKSYFFNWKILFSISKNVLTVRIGYAAVINKPQFQWLKTMKSPPLSNMYITNPQKVLHNVITQKFRKPETSPPTCFHIKCLKKQLW